MKPLDQHIQQELEDAPQLKAWGGKEPWQAPEGYFEKLSGQIKDRIEDEALLDQSPLLRKAAENFFPEVPEGYFEHFPKRIEQQTSGRLGRLKPLGRLWPLPSYSLAIAAAVLLLLLGVWVVREQKMELPGEEQNLAITAEDLIAFAELEAMDPYAIAAVLDLSEVDVQAAAGLSEEDLPAILQELELEDLPLNDSFFDGIDLDNLN